MVNFGKYMVNFYTWERVQSQLEMFLILIAQNAYIGGVGGRGSRRNWDNAFKSFFYKCIPNRDCACVYWILMHIMLKSPFNKSITADNLNFVNLSFCKLSIL